jgi:predicted Zn-dependent protease
MGRFLHTSTALASLWLVGCGGLISNQQEVELGRGIHDQIRAEYRLVAEDDPLTQWAVELTDPLVTASARFRDPAEIEGYSVRVIADDELVNAFAAPGGYTYLSTGLILQSGTCSEIAGVMGHELAHVTERHGIERVEKGMAAQTLADMLLEEGLAKDAAVTIWAFLQSTKFSREDESEADAVGLQIAHDAGYNPYGLVVFFEKLIVLSGGKSPPSFLSSHPASADRVKAVSADIQDRYGGDVQRDRAPPAIDCEGTKMSLEQVKARIRDGKMKLEPAPEPPPEGGA